jgi:membrane fusion protein (multidrug efflux system)
MTNQAVLVDSQAKLNSEDKTGDAIYLAQLQQAQAAFDTAQLNLTNSVIKAPVNGTVVQVAVKVGENVTAGQTILSISDLDNTWISANIEEDKYGRLQVGQAVQVQIDAYPGTTFSGQVSELGGAAQSTFALIPTTNTAGNYTKVTQYFSCKITVDKKGLVLKPGMSTVINIHTGH